MQSFEALVAEASAAVDAAGWSFEWLEGHATEERPPWGYARLLAARLGTVERALDLDTGTGQLLAEAPVLPPRTAATEPWPPNVAVARSRLRARGVEVVEVPAGAPLPFADGSFDLVSSRHPVRPDWPEIARVLAPGGTYLAQHVGPRSAFELIERFVGPLPDAASPRHPAAECTAAEAAGLTVVDLRTARCRMELFDIGAVVHLLRTCVWWVPDFTVERYDAELRSLDEQIRRDGPFVAHSTRHLIEVRR